MKIVKGDFIILALEGQFDVIVHSCNCMCTMGAGIAKQIKAVFPEAYREDCKTKKGSREKLGSGSTVGVLKRPNLASPFKKIIVVNGYTQFDYRGKPGTVNVDYDAVRSVMRLVKKNYGGLRIGYPMIGAGLAGGDWNVISKIIDEELAGSDHTLVVFE